VERQSLKVLGISAELLLDVPLGELRKAHGGGFQG